MNVDDPKLLPEDEIRGAFQPLRPSREPFLEEVERRVQAGQERETSAKEEPWFSESQAAGLFPWFAFLGLSKVGAIGATSLGKKFAFYLSVPAASIFLALGTLTFGWFQIRRLEMIGDASVRKQKEVFQSAVKSSQWVLYTFWAVVILAPVFGASFLTFCTLLVSVGFLILLLRRLTALGACNRALVATCCAMGLMYLAIPHLQVQTHDPRLVAPQFLACLLALGAVVLGCIAMRSGLANRWTTRRRRLALLLAPLLAATFSGAAAVWNSTFPDSAVTSHVASFDRARYSSASWRDWEMVALSAKEIDPDLDLTTPRTLMEKTIGRDPNPYVMGVGIRSGLVDAATVVELLRKEDEYNAKQLLDQKNAGRSISSLEQRDPLIRSLDARRQLSSEIRSRLLNRLRLTLREPRSMRELYLADALLESLATQRRESEQTAVHGYLVRSWVPEGRYQGGGGFSSRGNDFADQHATWCAVQLMKRHGMPAGIDPVLLRAYLRHHRSSQLPFVRLDSTLVPGVAYRGLDDIPGFPSPGLWDYLRLERSLIAALLLVVLCIYAALVAPPTSLEDVTEETEPEPEAPTDPRLEAIYILIRSVGSSNESAATAAHAELVRLSGEDFGSDVAAWRHWLEQQHKSDS